MAYVDYSNNWVLDQFLTFLQANQLGTNDEHLYDSLAVEHNINTTTVDGTHKANSITGSMINTTPVSTGSQVLTAFANWTPSAGVYQMSTTDDALYPQIYTFGAWRYTSTDGATLGLLFFDGTNMRVKNGGGDSGTIYYQKF